MAVTIDELQLQTAEKPQPAPSDGANGSTRVQSLDVKAEIEKLKERELRLRAD